MNPVSELAEELGNAIVDIDYDHAWTLFAPWLQREFGAEELREQVEEQLRDMADMAGSDRPEHPMSCRVEASDIGFDELRKPRAFDEPRLFPKELTAQNFRGWLCVQLLPDPEGSFELETWFDLWLAVVDHAGKLRIGYLEIREPD